MPVHVPQARAKTWISTIYVFARLHTKGMQHLKCMPTLLWKSLNVRNVSFLSPVCMICFPGSAWRRLGLVNFLALSLFWDARAYLVGVLLRRYITCSLKTYVLYEVYLCGFPLCQDIICRYLHIFART